MEVVKIVLANLGSIATKIQNRIDDIPVGISGTELIAIVDEERLFMEEYTGLSIGSVDIAEKFQPALLDLASSNLLTFMETAGADSKSYSIGDFKQDKGQGSNTSVASAKFKENGMLKLKRLGSVIRFQKVLG